ncbi:MAG: Bug family tripartite tricarboxylate transporter substrate binding protein [Lautropia sp.]
MQRRTFLAATMAGGLTAGLGARAAADAFPSRPIRFIIPFSPGGTSEIVARTVSKEMGDFLGQNIVVESKAGGAGTIAMAEAAKSDADGYTMILTHIGTMAVNPYAMGTQSFDVNKDFSPVALLVRVPNLFVIHADVPAKDFHAFIALARSKPGELNYGSAGFGSAGHLAYEYLKLVTKIDLAHIAYRGTGPQLVDLLAGRTQTASAGTPALLPHIRSGKLRVIATGNPTRIPTLPDTPTVAELGYPGFQTTQWYGIHVRAGTPAPIVARLSAAAGHALKARAVNERFAKDDATPGEGSSQAYQAFIAEEQARWKTVVETAKIRIN